MSRSSLFLKAKNAVKFLLFREDNPKIGSASYDVGVTMFLALVPIVAVSVWFVFQGFRLLGFAGLIGFYVLVCIWAIEVPHIIFDR